MVINESKTKFMAIKGCDEDKLPFIVGTDNVLRISHCDLYTYLGSILTSSGSIASAVTEHAKAMRKHLLKLVSFLTRIPICPSLLRRKFWTQHLSQPYYMDVKVGLMQV